MVPPIEPNQPAPGLSLNSEPVPQVEYVEPVEPVKMKKQIEKVACERCGKQVSAKTLKYNHVHSCPKAKEQSQESPAVNIPEELIEHEIRKRMQKNRQSKLEQRQQKFDQLLVNAF